MKARKPRVFGIGLSRTGTTSLAHALETLGYRTKHWPTHMWDIHCHEAVTDISVSVRFQFLDKVYPMSKFIYTTREIESWIESCRTHWASRSAHALTGADSDGYTVTAWEYENMIYGSWVFNADMWREAYIRFDASVRAYFKDRNVDFLEMNISAGDGWDKLLPFMGLHAVPFPILNKTQLV